MTRFSTEYFRSLLSKVPQSSLTTTEISSVLDASEGMLSNSSMLTRLKLDKLTICGDVHGQYADMTRIFELNGEPSPSNPYLFNGDFVDRGPYSLGCIMTLLLHKLLDSTCMHLNRGNHELMEMNAYYGFRKELRNDSLFFRFNQIFNHLPLAHVVNDSVFVVHGGLSRKPVSLAEISNTTPEANLYHELLWNDPTNLGGIHSNPRGDGVYRFGPDVTETFLRQNGLKLLVRSHEMVDNGFEFSHNGLCCTVFSAPNYAGHFRNKGGYLVVDASGSVTPHSFASATRSRL